MTAPTPRPYQQDAIDSVIDHVKKRLSPCLIEVGTGGGKTVVIAELARFFSDVAPSKKVLCIAPSLELIEQGAEKYNEYGYSASIYCASAGSKCLRHQVIFASPQTALKSIDKIAHLGISAIIIDEAHGLTPSIIELIDRVKSYRICDSAINEKVRIIGMTATPYRMGTGYIYASDHTVDPPVFHDEDKAIDPYFSRLLYKVGAGDLLGMGFLTKPVIGEEGVHYDTSGLELDRTGKFSAASNAITFEGNNLTKTIIGKVVATVSDKDMKGVMIFAATISHAEEIANYLRDHSVAIVTGKTKKKDRAKIIGDFKAQKIKYLVNVAVLCTGFNATHVDLIVILRATESAGLLQQIIGRGLRLHPGKESVLVLDYAENIKRHGLESDVFTPEIKTRKASGEAVEIQVECPACHAISMKKRRNDPMYTGLAHDRFGNFLVSGTERVVATDSEGDPCEWDGMVLTTRVMDPSTKDDFGDCDSKEVPVPAHYSRRCSNPEAAVIKGVAYPCTHRFSFKMCPDCLAENDSAARHCTECKIRLVDPNEKLTEKAGVAGIMAEGETKDVLCLDIKYEPYTGQDGKHSLKVVYKTEIGAITAWHTKGAHWIFNRMATANGWELETIGDEYSECADWRAIPKAVKVKKTMGQNGYYKFEVKGVSYV